MMITTSLHIELNSGLLHPATHRVSPYYDDRPPGCLIDMVVIHGISLPPGQFGTGAVEAFFGGQLDASAHPYFATIAPLRVSAHLFIKRTGEIVQFVPFDK